MLPVVYEYEKSFGQYPNIKPGEEFTGYRANVRQQASDKRPRKQSHSEGAQQPAEPEGSGLLI